MLCGVCVVCVKCVVGVLCIVCVVCVVCVYCVYCVYCVFVWRVLCVCLSNVMKVIYYVFGKCCIVYVSTVPQCMLWRFEVSKVGGVANTRLLPE